MFPIRTDLAVETQELYKESNKKEIPGVEVEKDSYDDEIEITRVKIIDAQGSKIMGKPMGNYITLEARGLKNPDADLKDKLSQVLAKELKEILPKKKNINTLVVGLGNWDITPDALGPQVISKILVTRHFFKIYKKTDDATMTPVSAISPGVMGTTGIETRDIIEGIVEKSKPDLIIAVDALASRKMERVSTTIQITDTGISPGSGIGSQRKRLGKETLGIPVIAIGVPTVVDAATMANDTIKLVIDNLKEQTKEGTNFFSLLEELSEEDKYSLIREVLEPYGANVIVTTKEIDKVISDLSQIIANGINIALHPGIDLKDVNRYIH